MASLPSIPAVKFHIFLDIITITVTIIFAGFFIQNQHRKYSGWRKHWPLSEQLATFFSFTGLLIYVAWIIVSTREHLQVIDFLHDYGRGEIPPGYLPPPVTPWGQKMKFLFGYGYFLAIWGIKGAFLAGYWRLRGTFHRPILLLLHATIVYTILTFVINLGMHTFSCRPISLNWSDGRERRCSAYAVLPNLTVLAATNITADLLVLLIPLLILSSFKLRTHERYSLAFVFVIGIMSIVAMAVRYAFAWKEEGIAIGGSGDGLAQDEWRKLFVTLEGTCAFCSFFMPAMRRVVRGFVARRWPGSKVRTVQGAQDRERRRVEESDGGVADDSGLGMTETRDSDEMELTAVYVNDEDNR